MKKINCGQLNINNVNDSVTLYGWVKKTRKMGEIIFGDIEDRWGVTQFVVSKDNPNFELISSTGRGSVIQIDGVVIERKSKNSKIPTGDIEIKVKNFNLINKSKQLPLIIEEKTDALEDVRMKYRYLDLRRPNIRDIFIRRHKLNRIIRNFLDKRDFIHLETPILTKPTPEGANDFLVEYSAQPGHFFALPQSPQIYKQLSMMAGFEKYYQIARCFRNEDLRSDRQLEFTQLDMELSFTSQEEIITIIENLMKRIMKEFKGIDLNLPFDRISYFDSMNTYGNDKPDLRYGLPIFDVTSYISDSGFEYLTQHKNTKAIFVPKLLSGKEINSLNEISKQFAGSSFTWAKISEELSGPASKKINDELLNIINDKDLHEGTLILVASNWKQCVTCLGAIRTKIANILNLINENEYKFVWVLDWPLFEYSEDDDRYVAMHHPFTAPKSIDTKDFGKNQDKVMAQAYDIVLNGYEIGGGSMRINTPEMQIEMFEALGMTEDEYKHKFGFLLEALSYGCPTHGGIALGIDRLLMILENKDTLKEVIAFPVNTSGTDMMMNSPTTIK